jgi:uracil-DNA glycosylase
MDFVVTDYDADDPESVRRVGEPIDGTAFFPGGHGIWRGRNPHGPLPTYFPDRPVMFVGHNFDKVAGYERSRKRGVEVLGAATWKNLLSYISFAGLDPAECFLTNALMGLQPSKALGKLKTTTLFREQCRTFLSEQIALVQPRLIVALGAVARADLAGIPAACDALTLMHPYAANMDKAAPAAEGQRLADAL